VGDGAIIITYLNSVKKNTQETQICFHVTKIMFASILKNETKILRGGYVTSKRAGERGGREDRAHRTLGAKSQGKITSERQRFQRKDNIKAYVSGIDVSVN